MPRRSASARCSAATRPRPSTRDIRAEPGTQAAAGKHADRRHGRRHRHQHASASSPPKCVPRSATSSAANFTKPANHPEAQAAKDSFVEAHGELKTIAVVAYENRQRHSPARLRPAVQHLRAVAAGDAARFVDHARQGEPRDLRIGDAGRLPRASATTRRSPPRPWVASVRCSNSTSPCR